MEQLSFGGDGCVSAYFIEGIRVCPRGLPRFTYSGMARPLDSKLQQCTAVASTAYLSLKASSCGVRSFGGEI
jgi:hypothetical protein